MSEITLLMQMNKLPPEYISDDPYFFSSDLSTMDSSGGSQGVATAPPPTAPTPPFPIGNWRGEDDNRHGNRNRNNNSISSCTRGNKERSMAAMREMIFLMAAMQPIQMEPESVRPAKRRNVKISKDPQSVAARHRRERISERIRILRRLVPGGTKMDTASMLDEAIHYVRFLKTQVQSLEKAAVNRPPPPPPPLGDVGFPVTAELGSESRFPVIRSYPVMHTDGFEKNFTHQMFN